MTMQIDCPLCKASEGHKLYEKNSIPVLQCDRCTFVFATSPFNPDLYSARYFNGQALAFSDQDIGYSGNYFYAKKKEKSLNAMRELKRIHSRVSNPGRLLDIGCASGFFMDQARRMGWQTIGLEISEYASSFARRDLGLDVRTGTLETVSLPAHSFDVITAWDVIEHLPNPVEFISAVSKLLKSGGYFVCGTPNFDSWARKIRKQNWHHLRPPEHLSYFSPQTLDKLLSPFFATIEVHPSRAPVTCVPFARLGRKFLYTLFDIAASIFKQNEYLRAFSRKSL